MQNVMSLAVVLITLSIKKHLLLLLKVLTSNLKYYLKCQEDYRENLLLKLTKLYLHSK